MAMEWIDFNSRSLLVGPELGAESAHLWFDSQAALWRSNTLPLQSSWPLLGQAQAAIVQALLLGAMERVEALKKLAVIEPLMRYGFDQIHVSQKIGDVMKDIFGGRVSGEEVDLVAEKVLDLIRKVLAENPVIVKVGESYRRTD